MSSQSFSILLSSSGRRVGLMNIWRETLRDLRLQGAILATDISPLSAAWHRADRSFLVPEVTSANFIPKILEICKKNQVRLVIPTIDPELPMYASHREDFQRIGTTVSISSPAVIAIGGDKTKTHEWLTAHGFPTARQANVDTVLASLKEWEFPLIVKPRNGSASKGVAIVQNAQELAVRTHGEPYVVQSIAKGEEYTIDVLVNRAGRSLLAVPRKRLEIRAGEISKGLIVRSKPLEEMALRICDALPGAYGVITIQMFLESGSGDIRIIEINPRFGGGFPLTWRAGGNYPKWLVEELLDVPSTITRASIQDRLLMLRYDEAVYVDGSDIDDE